MTDETGTEPVYTLTSRMLVNSAAVAFACGITRNAVSNWTSVREILPAEFAPFWVEGSPGVAPYPVWPADKLPGIVAWSKRHDKPAHSEEVLKLLRGNGPQTVQQLALEVFGASVQTGKPTRSRQEQVGALLRAFELGDLVRRAGARRGAQLWEAVPESEAAAGPHGGSQGERA